MQITKIEPVQMHELDHDGTNLTLGPINNYITVNHEGQVFYLELEREYSLLEQHSVEDMREIAEKVLVEHKRRVEHYDTIQQMNIKLIDFIYPPLD